MAKKDIIYDLIPKYELDRILRQYECELDEEFLGFTEIYLHLSKIIPKHFTVIDFGCYLSAQAYCFTEHKQYIGVDVCILDRFQPENAAQYMCSIQDFIGEQLDGLELDTVFAICSYVPDDEAQEMVRETFKNVFVFYPANEPIMPKFK